MPRRDRHDTHLDGAALLCLSHVAYRSRAVADMADLTRLAHDHGARSAQFMTPELRRGRPSD